MDMGRTCSRDAHIVSLRVLRKLESRFCVWCLSLSSIQQRAGDIVTSQNGWMPSRARPRGSEPGHMLVAFFATLQLSKMHPNKKKISGLVSLIPLTFGSKFGQGPRVDWPPFTHLGIRTGPDWTRWWTPREEWQSLSGTMALELPQRRESLEGIWSEVSWGLRAWKEKYSQTFNKSEGITSEFGSVMPLQWQYND